MRPPLKLKRRRRLRARARRTSKHKSSKSKALPPSNFQEKSQTDQDENIERHGAISSKDIKSGTKIETSPEVNANAVPDPVPNSGAVPTSLPLLATPTPGFNPLPPVNSYAVTTMVSPAVITPSISPVSHNVAPPKTVSPPPASKQMPTVIIALLSVGAAFLLVGALVAYRLCRKPPKRTCPTPSLPILQDEYADEEEEEEEGDEESLFGGKERNSERPGTQDLWTWTQYTQPSLNKPAPALSGPHSPLGKDATSEKVNLSKRDSASYDEKLPYLFNINGVSAIESSRTQPPAIQQVQSALTRAVNRVSALSMSIYPGSPDMTGVGIAVSNSSPLTGDGMPALKRNSSKVSARRMSRYNNRKSMLNVSTTLDRDEDIVENHVLDDGSTYFGTEAEAAEANVVQGRARVKAPYGAGQLPRSSGTATNVTASVYNPFEQLHYVLPPLSPALKSNERRERDTKALANALGLSSPQLTLYPDDSVTLAGDRDTRYGTNHTRARSEVMTPTLEANARLGNLMLAEFGSANSLAYLDDVHPSGGGAGPTTMARSQSARKWTDDRPPRVPSPPTLPSLAQMALAHANPADFDDYRSPTYSIYGLYEADRKSRGQSGVGY